VLADFDYGVSPAAIYGVQSKLDEVWRGADALSTALNNGLVYNESAGWVRTLGQRFLYSMMKGASDEVAVYAFGFANGDYIGNTLICPSVCDDSADSGLFASCLVAQITAKPRFAFPKRSRSWYWHSRLVTTRQPRGTRTATMPVRTQE